MEKNEMSRFLNMTGMGKPTLIIRETIIPKEVIVKEVQVPHIVEKTVIKEVPVIRTVEVDRRGHQRLESIGTDSETLKVLMSQMLERLSALEAYVKKPIKVTKKVVRDDQGFVLQVDQEEVR